MAKLTAEQQAYVTKHHCKQLTFGGGNELYQTLYGAHTIADALEIEKLNRAYWRREAKRTPTKPVECSDEMMIRHERCVDEHGIGLC